MEYDETDLTGVRETSSSVQLATLKARSSKAAAATFMRVELSMDADEIATHLGYPDGRAVRAAVDRFLEQELKDNPQSISRMRLMAARRLENMLRPVMKKALDENHEEHLAAVARAQGLIKQWTDLYGLEAPKQVVVTNPTSEMIDAYAERILQAGQPKHETGDIFGDDADDSEILALEARRAEEPVDAEIKEDDVVYSRR